MSERHVILELKKLKKYFPIKRGLVVHALEDISVSIYEGEKFGVVGESGCGKSTLGRTILQLYPPTSGACIYYGRSLEGVSPACGEKGIDLTKLRPQEMRVLRRDMQIVFQDPAASLDPRQTVGSTIEEVFKINTDYAPSVRKEKTLVLLEKVGLKREHFEYYPHQLSGGQKQRVGIARAIALDPKFVVLDESVSALDVSIQAQILLLLEALNREKNLTYFFITHDLGVVKYFCDRVLVMYLGNVCELAPSKVLFRSPLHPYTVSLLDAVPRPGVHDRAQKERILEGEVPSAIATPPGCPFHTRCPRRMLLCSKEKPELREIEEGHFVACHVYA